MSLARRSASRRATTKARQGKRAGARGLGDVVGPLGDHEVEVEEPAGRLAQGTAREDGRRAAAGGSTGSRGTSRGSRRRPPAGGRASSRRRGRTRAAARPSAAAPSQRLERGDRLVTPQALVAVVRARPGEEEGLRLLREGDREALVPDADAAGQCRLPAEGEAVVVRARPQRRAVREDERQLAAGVSDRRSLAVRASGSSRRASLRSTRRTRRAAAEDAPVGEGQRHRGRQRARACRRSRARSAISSPT